MFVEKLTVIYKNQPKTYIPEILTIEHFALWQLPKNCHSAHDFEF